MQLMWTYLHARHNSLMFDCILRLNESLGRSIKQPDFRTTKGSKWCFQRPRQNYTSARVESAATYLAKL